MSTKLDKLISRLIALTGRGKIAWEETADENTFQAVVSDFVVNVGRIGSYVNNDHFFRLLDQKGRIVDEVTFDRATGLIESPPLPYGGSDWDQLRTLHQLARRSALHADDAVSNLLSSLEKVG
jgi:hypothetical protein